MVNLPKDEKSLRVRLLVSIQYTNVTDRQTNKRTDRQTPHDGIGHAIDSVTRQYITTDEKKFFHRTWI